MFGSGFGSRTTSAFGQTPSFGKPATSFSSGFGTTNNTSLFGQSTQPTTSLFGSTAPSFGQTTSTTQSFGNFGGGTGNSIFGAQQTQAAPSGNLFGGQNAAGNTTGGNLFGSPSSSAFGSNTGFGSFGSPSNASGGLFAPNQQAATQPSSLFGAGNAGGSALFGSSSSAFSSTGVPTGTTIKFTPFTGTDTVMKNGIATTISTKHHCITCMKEYENKSLEELRFEDYLANRKGPAQGAQTASGLFGSTPQAPLFGGNTSTASTSGGNIFGSSGFGQTNVFGQNSLQQNNSLFGKPASTSPFGATTTTPSTGFSNFGQSQNLFGSNATQVKPGFGSATTATGLFNPAVSGTSNFGTQSPGFGFNAQQQNQGIGLFGQQQNKFGGFGAQTTSNFTFGSNTSAANTTSLFGQKPATTGFGIAPTSTANTFGAATPFGSGAGVPATGSGGTGIFGSGFNKPAGNAGFPFGQNTATSSALGGAGANGGNTLFGNTVNKPTSLFGGTNTSSSSMFGGGAGVGFGSNSGFGSGGGTTGFCQNFGSGSGGFGGNANAPAQNAPVPNVCDQIQILSVIPYGNSSLYKHVRPSSLSKSDDLSKSSVMPQKPTGDSSNFKISTQINNIVNRRAYSALEPSKKSLFDKMDDEFSEKSVGQQRSSPRYLKLKPKTMIKTKPVAKDDSKGKGISTLNEETNKENINSFASLNSTTTSPKNDNSVSVAEGNEQESSVPNDTMLELGTRNKPAPKMGATYVIDESLALASNSSLDNSEIPATADVSAEKSVKAHVCNVKLERADYFTVPSLNELDEVMDSEGRCIVKNFTVGRHKYGNVTFYDAFDVAGLDLDSIVFFRHKEVEIYPDDTVKPPVGTGLNRRAQVTLDRVWPIDKSTREIINSPERLKSVNFVAKLKRSSAKMNAQFIEYRPLTGSWVFEVEHFSKYGLDESDDEESEEMNVRKPKKVVVPKVTEKFGDPKKIFSHKENSVSKKRGLDGSVVFSARETNVNRYPFVDNDEVMIMDDEQFPSSPKQNASSELYAEDFHSPIEKLARNLDTSLHRVQLMKASFYDHDDISEPEISLDKGIPDLDLFATGRVDAYRSSAPEKNALPLIKMQFTSQFPPPVDVPLADFSTEEYRPPIYSPELKFFQNAPHIISRPLRVAPKYRNAIFSYRESVFDNMKQLSLCDTALYFGQHFKIGWSHKMTLVCPSSVVTCNAAVDDEVAQLNRLFAGRKAKDYSPNVLCKLQMKTCPSDKLEKNAENHLEICLKESIFNYDDGLPLLTPKLDTVALHEHCDVEQQTVRLDEDYDRQVWELMVALWGNLTDSTTHYNDHKTKILRKNALSSWLKNIVSGVDKDNADGDFVREILSLLSCGKIYEACKIAMMNGDHNLALIISQIGGSEITRSLMELQLKQWHESEADQLIKVGRLKIMTLVAGHMLYVSSKGIVNTCENLDWKRAFALHLWYICRPSDSLTEALSQYETAFTSEDKFAAAPLPSYIKSLEFETSDGRKIEDLCFHLMKLFSRRSYPLETVLNPITHTSNVLDYRLSWFVMITLKSLGYSHLSEESEYVIHTSFAAQLEIAGMWHWSIFVLLHMQDLNCRSTCVKNIIDKNVELLPNGKIGLTEKEEFVCDKLEIPCEWVYHSKATLAESLHKYREAAWYFVKAKRWNEVHEILMNQIVARSIINENYTLLQELIDEIVASEQVICGWNHKGAVIYDYLNVINKVNLMIQNENIDAMFLVESAQSLMSSVCTKIKYFPASTPRERLCQAEISKRMIQLIRTVLGLQCGKSGIPIRFIITLVDQLPLPEDYKQQELQDIISWWVNK